MSIFQNDVVILAGGLGTRLRRITGEGPKVLAHINGVPFIKILADYLMSRGFRRFIFCLGHGASKVEAEIRSWSANASFQFTHDSDDGNVALGTAVAVRLAIQRASDPFWLVNGDTLCDVDFSKLEGHHLRGGFLGTLAIYRNCNALWPSNIEYAVGRVVKYSKGEPSLSMEYIDAGTGIFTHQAFNTNECADLSTVIGQLAKSNKLGAITTANRFYEINTPESIRETEAYLSSNANLAFRERLEQASVDSAGQSDTFQN